MKLSVIIPVYNEYGTLEEIVRRVRDVDVPKEIILVDDCSTDGTRELYPSLEPLVDKIVLQSVNRGKGAAIREGLRHVTGEFVIVQDADLEYDPQEYHVLLGPLLADKADVVYGSRFLGGMPHRVLYFWHMIGNRLLTLLSNMTTNLNLSDMETCFKMFRTDIIRDIRIEQNRFGFEPEITAKVARKNVRFYEVGISYSGRTYAEGKKINWKDGFSAVWCILKYGLLRHDGGESALTRSLWDFHEYAQWIYDEIRDLLGERVLEIGAARSGLARFMTNKEEIVLADADEAALEAIEQPLGNRKEVQLVAFDPQGEELPEALQGREFDTVLVSGVLDRCRDDDSVVERLVDLVEEDGRLVLIVPAEQALFSSLDKRMGRVRRYEQADLIAKLAGAGLRIERFMRFNPLGAIGWFVAGKILRMKTLSDTSTSMARWSLGLAKWMDGMRFFKFGSAYIIAARRK